LRWGPASDSSCDGVTAAYRSEEVITHARSVLAGFKTPKYVVITNHLPKNPSGKILKRQLRDDFAHLAES